MDSPRVKAPLERWEQMECRSEAEWEAVRHSMLECPVAWEWLRLLLRSHSKVALRQALEQDGDASARAKGAALAYDGLMSVLSEMRKEQEDSDGDE